MDFKTQLKSLGLSITLVRLAVLNALIRAPHSEAAQIFELVQQDVSTTSIQAVYKKLDYSGWLRLSSRNQAPRYVFTL